MREPNIVVVTCASRGLGRPIARQFGRAGATVYLTSRAESADALAATVAKRCTAGPTPGYSSTACSRSTSASTS